MEPKKTYVVEKLGYEMVVVKLSENEFHALNAFLLWANLDEDFEVSPVEEFEAEEWGE